MHQVWEWLLGPLKMEAVVLAEGVRFVWEVAICDVVFESDSKIVSNAVLGNTTPPIAIANVNHIKIHLNDQNTHIPQKLPK